MMVTDNRDSMNVAVLGVGADGRDIASLCARAGHAVNLYATDATKAMDRIDAIELDLVDAATAGEISEQRKRTAIDELQATTGLSGAVAGTDVVIETRKTAAESLQEQFAQLEETVQRETLIVASGTAMSVTTAAAGLRHPDRALGMHFFALPDPPVVELLIAEQTTMSATERAESFLESLGTTPVRVKDSPGIASTRLELATEVEAMRAVDDGVVGVEGIDTLSQKGYQQPIGPLERADRAGLDRRLEALNALAEALGPQFQPPELLAELVDDGQTGLAAGRGFYEWDGGEPVGSAIEASQIPKREPQPDDPTQS